MKLALVIAFVILTNPLLGQQRWVLIPEPSSLTAINTTPGHCQAFDETGVGCTEAFLTFSRVKTTKSVWVPETVDVEFFPGGGKWRMTVRYSPKLCKSEGAVWVCKQVSWRTAK